MELIPFWFGYLLGEAKYKKWEEFLKGVEERLNHLAYFEAPIPYGFIEESPAGKVYLKESLLAYLYGLPNASLILAFRALIEGIKEKYKEVEGKNPPKKMSYADLIEWAHKFLREDKELAHGFKVLRNWVEHEGGTVKEQDALEVFRHVCSILNLLYPLEEVPLRVKCPHCGSKLQLKFTKENPPYFGRQINVKCANCKREFPVLLNI